MDDLITRLEKEGGSRELDAAITCALRVAPPDWLNESFFDPKVTWRGDDFGGVGLFSESGRKILSFHAAPITQSLDAAIALCERVLPYPEFVQYSIEKTDLSDRLYSVVLKRKKFDPNPWIMRLSHAYANTAPVAVCIALLRALEDGK